MVPRRQKSSGSLIVSLINAAFWLCMSVLIAVVAGYFLIEYSGNPVFRTYVVQSGSMEPSIMTGDIIAIMPQPQYVKSDVITFHGAEDRIITHRITETKQTAETTTFITKGDANRETDTEIVPLERIIGKVVLVIPKLGYFVTFGKSFYGIILLVVVPTAIIVADELGNIILSRQKKR